MRGGRREEGRRRRGGEEGGRRKEEGGRRKEECGWCEEGEGLPARLASKEDLSILSIGWERSTIRPSKKPSKLSQERELIESRSCVSAKKGRKAGFKSFFETWETFPAAWTAVEASFASSRARSINRRKIETSPRSSSSATRDLIETRKS
jgi:hypothetical protein